MPSSLAVFEYLSKPTAITSEISGVPESSSSNNWFLASRLLLRASCMRCRSATIAIDASTS